MEEISDELRFKWIDYTLFCTMLGLSAGIGIYFGFFNKKQDSPSEYLHGGKKMKILPIAASLIASDISGITLLGVPSDVFTNGMAYSLCCFSSILVYFFVAYISLPVYYTLQLTSCFEYLKLRFSNRVCVIASFVFAANSMLYLPVVIYIPALAFNQVTGLNLNVVIPIVCLICIFYTTIGGIKAVVWTDTLQMVMMVGSLLVVFSLGVWVEGGFATIWQKAEKGGRINFDLDADPTSRTATFTIIIGLSFLWSGYGNNPIFVQRFLAVPTIGDAKLAAFVFNLGTIFFKFLTSFLGIIIFAHYSDCNPVVAGSIEKSDQLLPFYVMEVASAIPGLPGLFIAGIFCAALSSMSSGLNTMAGTIYEDFIKHRMPTNTTEKRASDVMKLIVVILGLVCMVMVFVVQHLGAILPLTYTIAGISSGPVLAIFTLGMLAPFTNEKGIIYGCVAGVMFISWVVVGTQYYIFTGRLKQNVLSASVDGCAYPLNNTFIIPPTRSEDFTQPMYIYRISFYYYCLLGFIVTTLIAVPVSWFTGGREQTVDRKLLSPVIHPFLSKKRNNKAKELEKAEELIHMNQITKHDY